MRDVTGCSDGRARWSLGSDEKEEYDQYGDRCTDDDAPCDLSISHDGVRDGVRRGAAWRGVVDF